MFCERKENLEVLFTVVKKDLKTLIYTHFEESLIQRFPFEDVCHFIYRFRPIHTKLNNDIDGVLVYSF